MLKTAIFGKAYKFKMSTTIESLCRCVLDEDGEVGDWCDCCMYGPVRTAQYYIRDGEVIENEEWVIAFLEYLREHLTNWLIESPSAPGLLNSLTESCQSLPDTHQLKLIVKLTCEYYASKVQLKQVTNTTKEDEYDEDEEYENRLEYWRDKCRDCEW